MVVYIEYAFLENTLFDFALLYLSARLCKIKTQWWKILIAACVGGGFAIIFPLLTLPSALLLFLKFFVGLLLCLLAFPRIKRKKDLPRYALNAFAFFALTFLYGGALTAALSAIFPKKIPVFAVVIGFAALSIFAIILTELLYKKKRAHLHIYECVIGYKQKQKSVLGYLDSGNTASKNGLPVCFLAPDVFYDLFGEELLAGEEVKMDEDGGQVRDEMQIVTMSGKRKIPLYKGEIEVRSSREKKEKKQVYFSPAKNMINREYQVLLNAGIIKG